MNKILMFGSFAPKGVEYFRERCAGKFDLAFGATYDDLATHSDATYIVLRGPVMDAARIATLKNAKVLHRWGVGYNDVDVKAAGERGIRVGITAGMNAQPVAEMAALLILASFRHLCEQVEDAKHKKVLGTALIADSWMIGGRRVGIVGMGAIGRRLTKIMRGFGADVVYYDVFRPSPEDEKELGVAYLPFEELLKTSDIVSLHMPLLDSTRRMIDARALSLMKPTALLVNTARGGIVDTDALIAAVRERRLWGAALDTIEGEPLDPGHPVFAEPHILLTPHAAGNTEDNVVNMAACILDNFERVERGEEMAPRCLVNGQYLKL